QRTTLLGNWRSDARMIQAVNAVFGGVEDAFLYPFIGFRDAVFPATRATPEHEHKGSPPLTIWRAPDLRDENGKLRRWTKPRISERLLAQACATIKTLLREVNGEPPSIAVLVDTNSHAEAAARALAQWNL